MLGSFILMLLSTVSSKHPPSAIRTGRRAFASLRVANDVRPLEEMKILVAGSTGGTGLEVVKQLVAKNVAVTAIARDAEKAKEILPTGAEILQGNVLDTTLVERAMTGIDAVVCALGPKNLLNPLEPYLVDDQGHCHALSMP